MTGYGVKPFRLLWLIVPLLVVHMWVFWPDHALYPVNTPTQNMMLTGVQVDSAGMSATDLLTLTLTLPLTTAMPVMEVPATTTTTTTATTTATALPFVWADSVMASPFMAATGPSWNKLATRFAFSIGNFVPLVDLHLADEWTPHPRLRGYNALHTLLGWLLIPLLVAALAGLLSKK
jgi:hypothetical protein